MTAGSATEQIAPRFTGTALAMMALAITALASALAWLAAGTPALIGIDDAAITRNYAENIANGHGIVYFVGGERVEGATSALWTLMVAGTYLITPDPELLIIGLGGLLTAVAVFAVLALGTLIARQLDMREGPVAAFLALGLLAQPGYFFWSVFTMMELALWSALVLVLVWRLGRLIAKPKRWDVTIIAMALLVPLIRPEGIAVTLGLLAFTVLLLGRFPRGMMVAVGAALLSIGALTGFRLMYFGLPVPNTFYAKVSSDRIADAIDGAKYLFSFVTGYPFAELFVLLWAVGAIWALSRYFSTRPDGSGSVMLVAATIVGFLLTYVALGGDHFEYWRFYQPIAPLLPLMPALMLAGLSGPVAALSGAARGALVVVGAVVWLAISYGDYRQARFDLVKEMDLVQDGVVFGAYADTLSPQPTLGVIPAGGIALGYGGPIRDLLGLNWVEMAHADPLKEGIRNHASFDPAVFWRHEPHLIPHFNRPCAPDTWIEPAIDRLLLKGLYDDPRFRERYQPVRLKGEDRCWRGYARRDWVGEAADPRIEPVPWTDVTLL